MASMASMAQVEVGIYIDVYGPSGESRYEGIGLGSLGGQGGYCDDPNGLLASDYFQPGVYAGKTRCRTSTVTCSPTESRAYGDVNASTGRIRARPTAYPSVSNCWRLTMSISWARATPTPGPIFRTS